MDFLTHPGIFWSRSHWARSRLIVEILTRHGFGALISQFGLGRYGEMPRRILRRQRTETTEQSPAQHLRLALEELGPTFIKVGQLLSTRPDLLPATYIDELKQLQDNVPPLDWSLIAPALEAELGRPAAACFATLESTPLAAASLGQVHAATLPSGEEVVIKVQRPGIEPQIELDLEILLSLARTAQNHNPWSELYNLAEMAEEFATIIRNELDYQREARNAERLRSNFARVRYVHIPRIHSEYTTRRLLVMERLSGIKIDAVNALREAGYDCRQVARHATHFVFKEILEDGFFHADPHPGNYVVLPGIVTGESVIGVMDFGKVGYLAPRDRIGLTLMFVALLQSDAQGLAGQMLRLGFTGRNLDRRALERDLGRLLSQYQDAPLQEISLSEMLNNLVAIIFRHQLRLPADFVLLLQTLSMMEAAALKLDPKFDIFAVGKSYAARMQRRLWRPKQWGADTMSSALVMGDLLARFPAQLAHLLERMDEEEFGVQIRLPEIPSILHELDRIANQLTVTVLTAAFIIAIAWLIPQVDLTWPWSFAGWLVIGAFAIVCLSGLWLLWRVLRSD